MPSRQLIREEVAKEKNELRKNVLFIFLGQPSMIGPNADNLRHMNMSDPKDRRIYDNAVMEDYEEYVKKLNNSDKELAKKFLLEGWELFEKG